MIAWEMVKMTCLTLIVAAVWCSSILSTEVFAAEPVLDPHFNTYKIIVVTAASSSSCEKEFLSVAIGSSRVQSNWDGTNFSSPKLQNIAAALAPSDLRLGGTKADFLIFNSYASGNKITVQKGTKTKVYINFTMSGQQWDDLTTFVKKVGWNLIFDFNIFLRSHGVWDPSNANLLLNYSAARDIRLAGFELGNEPAHYQNMFNITITPTDLIRDFKILRNVISNYSLYKSSGLFGPGTTYGSLKTYLRMFVEAGGANVVDEIAFHHYYINGATAKSIDFLNTDILDSLRIILDKAIKITSAASRPVRVRLSETSSCYGGGAPNLSNAYVAGFMWLDKLGIAAQYGLSRVFRQTFMGGSYELVDLKTSTPNPDYYLSVLFKRLVEGPVFSVTSTPALGQLRVYANCARKDFFNYPPGALVLYYLNVGTEKAVLSLTQFPEGDREVFFLTPGDERGLTSRLVKINGQLLLMNGDHVPQMVPSHQRGDITVEAQSFGFIVLPQANVPACGYFKDLASSDVDGGYMYYSCTCYYLCCIILIVIKSMVNGHSML